MILKYLKDLNRGFSKEDIYIGNEKVLNINYQESSSQTEWLLSERQEIINADKVVEKREPLCTIGEIIDWYSHYGKQYRRSSKIKKWNYNMIQQFHFWEYI